MKLIPARDHSQFQSLLRWAIFLPVLFAILVGGMFYWRVRDLTAAAHWVDHADQVIGSAIQLENLMLDSESSVRGYIINQDLDFLSPYEQAVELLPEHLKKLNNLLQDEPEQNLRLAQMQVTIEDWQTLVNQALDAMSEGKSPKKVAPNSHGKKLMDQFRDQLDDFIQVEQTLRDSRARTAEQASTMAMMNGLVLALLLGTFLTVFTRKSLEALSRGHQRVLDEVEFKANALSDSESRFRTMANSAPVMIWTAGLDKKCDWFSDGWLNFTGRTLTEELAERWSDRVHPDDYHHTWTTFAESFDRKESFEMEYRLKRRDGTYRWILDRGAPRISEGEVFSGYIGSCLDVNDRVDQQEKLKAIAKDLQKAVSSRDDFLSVASHELKTPLTVLKLQLQLNSRATKPDQDLVPSAERLQKFFRICLDQTNRLDNLVEDLLDVTRIQQGKLNFHFEEIDLAILVQEQVAQFAEPLKSAACPVTLHAQGPVLVRADRFRMEQVVVNLLTNAMKYGAGHPIDISVASDLKFATLSVHDHGIGIEASKQSLIFERFERVLGAQNVGGMGLGLYIAKQIVNAHQGVLHVESVLGQGSNFVVSLPVESKEIDFERTPQELTEQWTSDTRNA